MRCFVGILLPKEIKDELYSVQNQFPSKLAKIKWISKSQLHLTLKFLGKIKQEDINKLKDKLSTIKFKPFKVKLSELGVFPNLSNPKIIWVSLLPGKKVIELQQKVDGELLNIFKFDQKFKPHLTLGRIKMIKKKKEFISKFFSISVDNKGFEISSFSLIKSTLNKDGPVYEVLEDFEMKDNL